MFKIISIYMPPFEYLPENYHAANLAIHLHYAQEGYFSSKDRKFYLVTKDSLEKVIEKVAFKSSKKNEDYTFQEVPNVHGGIPEDAREWISNRFSSIESLRTLLQSWLKGN